MKTNTLVPARRAGTSSSSFRGADEEKSAPVYRDYPPLVPILNAITIPLAAFLAFYAPWQILSWRTGTAYTIGQWLNHQFLACVAILFGLNGFRWLVLLVFAWLNQRRDCSEPIPQLTHWPRVSVFVPAFNESETIRPALESLLELDYPDFEILVVDDGSTDDTFAQAKQMEGDYGPCRIRVFRKPNGGKWTALNFAFRHATAELILSLDADSRVEPPALKRLVTRMVDPRVGAVSGNVRVRNRINLLTRCQAMEYILANGSLRLAQSYTSSVLLVPGPIGLFRRSALEEVFLSKTSSDPEELRNPGPFSGATFAEDFDLSMAILAHGHRIVYEPDAVSNTKAPTTTFTLINQRYRWTRGTLQVLRKYWHVYRSGRSQLGRHVLAWSVGIYGYELVALRVIELVNMYMIIRILLGGSGPLLIFWLLYLLFVLSTMALFTKIHRDSLSVLLVMPVLDFYQCFLLGCCWLIALVDEIRGVPMRW